MLWLTNHIMQYWYTVSVSKAYNNIRQLPIIIVFNCHERNINKQLKYIKGMMVYVTITHTLIIFFTSS